VSRLLGAELLKLRTTRAPYIFLLAAVALTGIAVAGTIAATPEQDRTPPGWQLDIVSSTGFSSIVALLLGVTLVTTEWRHGTITPAFLGVPERWRLLAAKELTALVVGLALAAVSLVVAAAIALPWLSALGEPLALGDVAGRAARLLLAGALYGAFGAAVGMLVQNQAGAIAAAIVWILVVESLVALLLSVLGVEAVADFLPGRALSALDGTVPDGLDPWLGAVVAAAWIGIVLALGVLRTEGRDVT
jgi:ABC-type transport system involved in multi-copper enzyme maturation permease subunit